MKLQQNICSTIKIFIDNGHGRNTAGKRSPDGQFLEYYYNRIVAHQVTAKLQALGLDAELLVPEVDDVSLAERCRRVITQEALESIAMTHVDGITGYLLAST